MQGSHLIVRESRIEETPRGYHTGHGLTLEFWMKRDDWVNPYSRGAAMQNLVTVDLEREYKGQPRCDRFGSITLNFTF